MYHVIIRYHDELNFFLKRNQRDNDIFYSFSGRRSVKDLVESMGIPHVEVDLILVNGLSEDFSYIVNNGDRINVYPEAGASEMPDAAGLRLPCLTETKFVLDVHLRKLARGMRLLGFDADFSDDRDDAELAGISHIENRILLTCDRQLLMRKIVSRGYIIRSRIPDIQIVEVIEKFHLRDLINPFTRCIECNGIIESIDIKHADYIEEAGRIPEGVLSWCNDYFLCASCRKIYWRGSHYDRLSVKIENFIKKINHE